VGSGLSGRLGNQRVVTSGTTGAWNPANVPEVAAGYFWLAASATGAGTAAFKVPEGNGHSTFDLVQATVANQPTVLTEAGGTQFRMRKVGDAVGASIIAMAAPAAAGWTGNTYIGIWARLPDASGDISGSGTVGGLFSHNLTTGNQRRLSWVLNGNPDVESCTTVDLGAAGVGHFATSTWANRFDGNWHWLELLVRVGVSHEMYDGLSLVTPASSTVPQATLVDSVASISLACRATGGLGNVDTTDWAACYYANGIPSLPNREALMRHLAPR
jgi:hypothetical protein